MLECTVCTVYAIGFNKIWPITSANNLNYIKCLEQVLAILPVGASAWSLWYTGAIQPRLLFIIINF